MDQDGHIFVIPSYLAVLWERNQFETWFYRKVQMQQYSWIFLPINKNQNHWILLAANVPQRKVSILDSMGGKNEKYIIYWRKYMKMRSEKTGELDGEWNHVEIKSSHQKDGHSCGPFVLMNALALSRGLEPSTLTQTAASIMRENVPNKIVSTATKPHAQRTICDFMNCKGRKSNWVQCEVCGRWLHFNCLGLKSAPQNDYVCVICNAQNN